MSGVGVTFELVGGPLDGELVTMHEGNRYHRILPPEPGFNEPREARYTVGWVHSKCETTINWSLCLIWDGDA